VTAYISSKETGVLKRFFGKKPGDRQKDFSELTVRDIMASPCVTVAPEMSVEEAAKIIVDKNFNTLPVVKSDNMLLGVVTAHDLLKAVIGGKQ
jgi:CBS-domain-containing membrane protein